MAKVHGAGIDTVEDSDATGAADSSVAEGGDAETPIGTARDIEDVGAAEHTDGVEHVELSPRIAGQANHVHTGASDNESRTQILQVTTSLRDDWLHWGDALQDMDLHTNAKYIERRRKPIPTNNRAKLFRDCMFAFDSYSILAPGYMQVHMSARRRKIVRFVVGRCERENEHEGQEKS